MAKSENQKLKLLYILKILQEKSDEKHPVSTKELIDYLDREGIAAERKTIYTDIHALEDFGYPVKIRKGKTSGYYLESREFEMAELKMLADAVLACKFISQSKTKEIIDKLSSMTSVHEAKQLQRQVWVERIKNAGEGILENVDRIHMAIMDHKKIAFTYFSWGTDKQLHARRNAKIYRISPFFLIWKDEYYYLIAYDSEAAQTKYYRVDKMKDISILEEKREGSDVTGAVNPADVVKRDFSMYAGEQETLTLTFPEDMIGVVIDRFGKEISLRKREEDLYSARVQVSLSPIFYGWLTGFSGKIRILQPESVKSAYLQYLKDAISQY